LQFFRWHGLAKIAAGFSKMRRARVSTCEVPQAMQMIRAG
jgi:hypothetical protein